MSDSTKHTLRIVFAIVVIVWGITTLSPRLFSDSGSPEPSAAPSYPAGAPAVFDQISASTDCYELRHMYATARDNHQRYTSGSPASTVTGNYMAAARDRLEQLGCYAY